MKLINYKAVTPVYFDNDAASGVAGRVAVGKADGANNFCMRIFEIAPGGHTPKHAHPWEHEMFIHSGAGEIYASGKWNPIGPGNVVFMPPNEEHQVRNTGKELLILACMVPSIAPEI
ncbi:MAG TPA: cupin domain-containing protein [Smithella sp.]|nr:cupin domain-containing protein [Smithella sp.]